MKIYIPTKGRTNKQITLSNLPPELRKRTVLVADHIEYEDLHKNYPEQEIWSLGDAVNSIGKVRQHIIDNHSVSDHGPKLIMLDDDLGFNMRREDIREKFLEATPGAVLGGFEWVERLLEQYAHGGIRYRQMSQDADDIEYNCRVLRALAFNVLKLRENNIRFDRLIVMEDFDVTLQLLRLGYPNFSISTIIQGQGSSNAAGGCSSYRDAKRQKEGAEGLAAHHPDFVKVRVAKTNWKDWGSNERTDVTVYWKKAYANGTKK